MLTGQKEQSEKKHNGKAIVGYDLGKNFSQISFCTLNGEEPETVSAVAGTKQFNIPTLLCKRKGVNQWFYGKEAQKYAQEEEGVLIEDLQALAERGEDVLVEGESFDPTALLTLFVKRSLSLLSMQLPLHQIEAFLFTAEDLSPRMVDVLSKVAAGLQLKANYIFFQSHLESFYYYTLYQPTELWKQQVLVFDYNAGLKAMCLECNKKTTPRVVFISQREYPQITRIQWAQNEEEKEIQKKELDLAFLAAVEEEVKNNMITTVYLVGDGFKENWAQESLKLLCRNRRVFQGNNLYSKGACYGGLERLNPGDEGKNYVYLGTDKLKANIGMKALRRGEDSYFAILDAGTNWYEASADFDIILESGNTIDLIITPLTGDKVIDKRLTLEGLPERPERTTRLSIHIEMSAVDKATLTIEDKGFGELYPSSGKGWTQTIGLTG